MKIRLHGKVKNRLQIGQASRAYFFRPQVVYSMIHVPLIFARCVECSKDRQSHYWRTFSRIFHII